MNLSDWSIRNPVASILLFVLLMFLGWQSFKALPVTRFPSLEMPLVVVSVRQSGATPTELEKLVAQLVEDAVAGLSGVKDVTSDVTDGLSQTRVEFRMETPVRDAVQDVRDAIARIRNDLPEEAGEPVVDSVDVVEQAVMTFAVSAPAMSLPELSWFVSDVIEGRLRGLAGVARVDQYGGAEREIRVELDPARLDAYDVTAAAVHQQLSAINTNVSAGRSEIGGGEQAIRLLGDQGSAEQLAKSAIALPSGQQVQLAHLGTVIDSHEELRSFVRVDGEGALSFAVFRTKGASELAVAESVNAALDEIRTENPHVTIALLDETVSFTAGNYEAAMHTLMEGAILAILVVLAFLRNWRATAIAGLALPLSIVPTFWLMEVLGFSLNLVSMLAITLATGVLVDDAIVEVENIQRHIAAGKSPHRAASEAANEINLAVIATTMTIVAVFVPVAFMPGISGQYFYQFGLTIAIAVTFSLLVARLITPLLAARFMSSNQDVQVRERKDSFLMRSYLRVLRVMSEERLFFIPARYVTLVVALGILLASGHYMKQIPSTFLPPEDTSRFVVSIELPPGGVLADTDRAAEHVYQAIRSVEGIRSVYVHGGFSPAGGFETRRASATILLEARHDTLQRRLLNLVGGFPHFAGLIPHVQPVGRTRPQSEIEVDVIQRLAAIPDVRSLLLNSRGDRDISYSILSSDGQTLDLAVAQLEAALAGDPLLQDVSAEGVLARPEVHVIPRAVEAARLGVTTADVARTVRVATTGDVSGVRAKSSVAGRLVPVRVQLADRTRIDIARLNSQQVATAEGRTVPMNAVADVRLSEGPDIIKRLNGKRIATIGASIPSHVPLGAATARFDEIVANVHLPAGVEVAESGDSEARKDLFSAFNRAMSLALVLVLLVLIFLFKSVSQPLVIVLSLPLSIGGVAAALILTSSPVSMPVLIGILMLMGIVAKNAILLVDCAIENAKHMTCSDAVVEAGRKRARPILMTSIAMSAGMLPSALGVGEGGAFRAPMATAVIGGILASTVLSLVIVPSFFLIMSDSQRLLHRLVRVP